MTQRPYIDHRTLQKWIDATPNARGLMADPETMDRIEPLSAAIVPDGSDPSTMGYMTTPDGRIAFRWCHSAESQRLFGRDALTTMEAIILTCRIAQMFDVEQAALDAQRDAVILRRALLDLVVDPTNPKKLTAAKDALQKTERK